MTSMLPRRDALMLMGGGGLTAVLLGWTGLLQRADGAPRPLQYAGLTARDLGWDPARNQFVLPPLPYAADALEPALDARTVTLHHDVHQAGYVRGLNAAIEELRQVRAGERPSSEVGAIEQKLAFNGSGHLLHVVYWRNMKPVADGGGAAPDADVAAIIDRDFGSLQQFTGQFTAAATSAQGSGWAILARDPMSGRLRILQAEKHQNGTMQGVQPLLACDVWEHAYYLKYQNRRADYVAAWLGLLDWSWVRRGLDAARRD